MSYEQGDVWWGPAPHKSGPSYRPWVIVSANSHPFAHTECIALTMTTQQHSGAIAVPDDAWLEGGSDADAYISPWYTTTIKHRDFDRQQGTLEPSLVAEAVAELQLRKRVRRKPGDSRREGAISKEGNGNLRWILVQCANVAVHNVKDPYLS